MKKAYGITVYEVAPCASGFGEWERTGTVVHLPKLSLTVRKDIDGLIKEQDGMTPVTDGETVGITRFVARDA